ncbi:hypothetical protein O3P69_018239 [Scylla paramamosain]|uniref:Methyltransferase domain-containing protein n=1 Tax=Scylla paramamosain TaxID=85552 RepID=A0AAW0TJB0_SCYPA
MSFSHRSHRRVPGTIRTSSVAMSASMLIMFGRCTTLQEKQQAAEGFTSLHGIDYSQKAVELAQAIAAQKEMNISYKKVDLVNCNEESLAIEYDVCHDKGTYDAVSLCPDDPSSKRAAYMKAIHRMTRKNGLFIITSCNWTQEELSEQFSDYFIVEHIIPMPTFMFGGKVGSRVSSVVFKKK